MKIWKRSLSLDEMNRLGKDSMIENACIVFTKIGDDFLEATMPVNEKTRQPHGRLHGGSSCVMIETLASFASYLCTEGDEIVVGTELNASHLQGAYEGQTVRAVCTPLRIGHSQHSFDVKLYTDDGLLFCAGRLTTRVIHQK
jgi:1,4-dihydroxy-2-naphthoyl-CoA hydrolase